MERSAIGVPMGSRFAGAPRVGFGTSEHGRDYRVGYGLDLLGRESLGFELGVEAYRRASPIFGGGDGAGTDQGVLGRATVRW